LPKAADIKKMFESLVDRYDLLNRVLSLGRDVYWRKELGRSLKLAGGSRGLDICCGTGDVSLRLLRDCPENEAIELAAADFSPAMCRAAGEKISAHYSGKSSWSVACADALCLPFKTAAFDFATVAFGVRNFEDLDAGLTELARVIRPGGRLGLLEFAPPRGVFLKVAYRPYLKIAPPVLGKFLASSPDAYRYLSSSIESFLEPERMISALSRAGFESPLSKNLTFGITCLYTALRR
jgi:demethylmenaquinone methyltransferase / 2-methoxy-6-polyprenyl-1,4-benzoquinol methylase